jgi:hypothetical protein
MFTWTDAYTSSTLAYFGEFIDDFLPILQPLVAIALAIIVIEVLFNVIRGRH